MTVTHSQTKLDNPSTSIKDKKKMKNVTSYYTDTLSHGVCQPYLDKVASYASYVAKSKISSTYIFPANRLPRNRLDIDRMAIDNPDRNGFIIAEA